MSRQRLVCQKRKDLRSAGTNILKAVEDIVKTLIQNKFKQSSYQFRSDDQVILLARGWTRCAIKRNLSKYCWSNKNNEATNESIHFSNLLLESLEDKAQL